MENRGRIEEFRAAGRALFSLGLVRGVEGNLSVFDGERLWITRTGAALGDLRDRDVLQGWLEEAAAGASIDLEVHRRIYRERGPGAVAHAHPPGTAVPGEERPGEHGVYVFAPSLQEAVAEVVQSVRDGGATT